MKFNYFTTKIPFLGVFSLVFLLASCGSYEYVGYDTDGIYGTDDNRSVEIPPQQQEQVETKNDGTYYKNYFSEKAREYEYAIEDGEIFTDIDSYEGDYNQEIDSLNYNESYAGWGQNNSNVTINVVDSGWYSPWGYNSWYGSPRYSYGWNSWGWNVGFGYPYYSYGYPYYGYGYGYGYPYYGYGYGYNGYPYYNNYYGNYNRRGIAYNAGRRGSYLNRDLSSINRANRSTSRLNSTSLRSRSRNQVYENNRSTRTRSNTRSTTPRNNSTRATSSRKNSTRATSTRKSTPRASTPRKSTPRASSSGSSNNKSSGSVSRSSSSSSSSGSRSSGGSRSSSRRN